MNLKEVLKTLNARFREKNIDKMDMDLVREYFRIFDMRPCWMSGSEILSDEEVREMIEDACDVNRGRAFEAARLRSQ